MAQPDKISGGIEAPVRDYCIKIMKSRTDADRVVEFFLSEDSFDDRNFTKGEINDMRSLPYRSLSEPDFQFWYAERAGDGIIGIISLRENEQKSGGYFIDYLAVHKQNRKKGIAKQMLDTVIDYVKSLDGRYIHANTCDTALYESVRGLFEKKGFIRAGHLPDYYFQGEGMIIFFRKM